MVCAQFVNDGGSASSSDGSYFTTGSGNPIITAFPWSVSVWVKLDTTVSTNGGEYTFMAGCDNTGSGQEWWHIRLDDASGSEGEVNSTVRRGGTFTGTMTTSNAITDTTDWHHIFLRRASGDHQLMLDGDTANDSTSADGTATVSDHNEFVLGGFQNTGANAQDHLPGRMAWVTIWDVGLLEREGLALSKGVGPWRVRPQSIIACYPLWCLDTAADEPALLGSNRLPLTYSNEGPTAVDPDQVADAPPVEPFIWNRPTYFIGVGGDLTLLPGALSGHEIHLPDQVDQEARLGALTGHNLYLPSMDQAGDQSVTPEVLTGHALHLPDQVDQEIRPGLLTGQASYLPTTLDQQVLPGILTGQAIHLPDAVDQQALPGLLAGQALYLPTLDASFTLTLDMLAGHAHYLPLQLDQQTLPGLLAGHDLYAPTVQGVEAQAVAPSILVGHAVHLPTVDHSFNLLRNELLRIKSMVEYILTRVS